MLGYKLSLFFYRRILIRKLKKLKSKDKASMWVSEMAYNQAIF